MKEKMFTRKLLVFFMILCFAASMFSSLALAATDVDFNVEDYTEEELIEIVHRIHDADTKLGYLYASDVLLVGTDIPAGHYEFWVEEDDVKIGPEMQEFLDDGHDYHCGYTELGAVKWGEQYDGWDYEYEDIYYDEYGVHKSVTLEEGNYIWVKAYYGTDFVGIHIKYFPNRQSGLF